MVDLPPRERGSATAETAVVLPALALVLVVSVWAVAVVGQQLQCIDAARTAARALARGEGSADARAAAREAAPAGARISMTTVGGRAVVDVRYTAGLPGARSSGAGVPIGSRAVAALEVPP